MEDLWKLERRLWKEGLGAYEELMAPDCLMAFGPTGIMGRAEIVDSMRDAPRWSDIDMTDTTQTKPADNVSVIAYRALAKRSGADPYEAVCTSTYIAIDGHWHIAQHQQSLASTA